MPGEPHCVSSSPTSHGYGGPPAPRLNPRRADVFSSVPRAVSHAVPHEKYKGIRFRPELRRYISEIRPAQPKKRKIWLGTYKTAEEAARAFDAGIYYTKKSLSYNFEDSPTILEPLPDNLSPEEEHVQIQKKAKLAAARAQPADPEQPPDLDDDHDTKLVTKSHSYSSLPRHNYSPHHFNLEFVEPFFQRHEIPREIKFAVLNR